LILLPSQLPLHTELLIVYLRYKSVHTFYATQVSTFCLPLTAFNFIGLSSDWHLHSVSACGNFQMTMFPAVHFLGAFVVFSAGMLYQWVHTYITYRVYRSGVAGHVGVGWVVAQAIISLLSLVFFVGATLFAGLAGSRRRHHIGHGTFHWSTHDGGFAYHVLSSACEWAMSTTFLVYFLTFHPDFKRMKIDIVVRRRSSGSHHGYDSIVNSENTPLTH
ncbi:DNA damage-regulated autophagy modulator protein 2, partial [Geodia barretti]